MSKGLEALERIIETFYDKESEDIKTVRKYLMTLEIVKKYHITPAFFAFNESYQAYIENMSFYLDDEPLMSEEEYNLAKEVLNA